MKTVSIDDFNAAIEDAIDELVLIAAEDTHSGTITALSYIDFEVVRNTRDIRIVAYNREFNGDPGEVETKLGYCRLYNGRVVPVIYVRRDAGIVTGEEALGPVFDLF